MPRFLTARPASSIASPRIEFYREEFVKHHHCLQRQREFFSPQAIRDVESALIRIIAQLDNLSAKDDADLVVARLLRELDVVTGLSAWSDSHNVH